MSMDYREYILDHYRNPRNYGKLEHPNAHAEDSNPLCGDQLALDLQIEGDQVTAIRFQGRGCAISQAAASMLSEMIEGKPVEEVVQLGHFFPCVYCIAAWRWRAWKSQQRMTMRNKPIIHQRLFPTYGRKVAKKYYHSK